jgi:hypothetical protein
MFFSATLIFSFQRTARCDVFLVQFTAASSVETFPVVMETEESSSSSGYHGRNCLPSGMRCRLKRCQPFHAKDGVRNVFISLYIFNIVIPSNCRPSKWYPFSVNIYQQNCIHLSSPVLYPACFFQTKKN